MEKGENFFEISLGSKPDNFDVAITSINSYGSVGELNTIVLDAFGLKYEDLNNLNLDKGFDVINQGNKTVLFIVTVGKGIVLSNLKSNLQSAFTTHLKSFTNKKVWIPLMGTGSGKLTFEESFLATKQVLNEYKKYIIDNNIQVTVSFPADNKSKDYYNEIIIKDDKYYNLIFNLKISFYLVGTTWGNEDQAERFYEESIWENGYEDGKYSTLINKVNVNDILIHKSSFPTKDKKSILRVKAFGIVKDNPLDGRTLMVEWGVKLEPAIDIDSLGFYRDTISRVSEKNLKTIFNSGNSDFKQHIYGLFSKYNKDVQKPQVNKPVTQLAGLISDTDNGEDYLNIKSDIEAFARVIAAKSFQPPLAIALLGKWGSGKSFFMRKLKENIQFLSNNNPQEAFCEGVVHVHFNAWSYMDANLWASIVTRIFEGLDEYINGLNLSQKEKKEIENELFQKLTISKEEHLELENQQNQVKKRLQELKTHKKNIKRELNNKISSVRKSTLVDIINKIDSEFKVQEKIQKTLNDNPTFVDSAQKFENIVPKQYWENPSMFYNELKSIYAFLKTFFYRKKLKTNIFWILAFLILIGVTPVLTFLTNLLLSWHDFRISDKTWITITIIGTLFTRSIDTYLKLKKQIAPFWHIKEKYEKEKEEAIFKFKQEQKAIKLEISQKKEEIIQVNKEINTNLQLQANLSFKLENSLSTHALYTFIEKRANSEDYKKHLGIVSLIRKDFEILSGLLTDHQTDLVSYEDSEEFKKIFKQPLERIILYIDDLDRCPEERVVEVLEAVNLLMAFPLFVVVVGVDPRWIKTALENKYKNQFVIQHENDEVISPSNYLEKIFQVPFHLKDAGDSNIKNMIKTLAQAKPIISNEVPLLIEELEEEPDFDPDYYDAMSVDKNEFKVTTNIFDNLLNKETIQALEISEKECELMQDMSEIIGNNPRAIKRFVNIYRIVKTHDEFKYEKSIEEKEFIVVMFLLALSIGKYKYLLKSFEFYLRQGIMNERPISDYFKVTNDDEDFLIDEKAKILRERLRTLLQIKLLKLYRIETDLFAIHYPFIKRFTFKNI